MRILLRVGATALIAAVLVAIPAAAMAHEHRNVGPLAFTVGWLNEPTYAGSVNAVQVELARGGSPVTDATLQVVVIFGQKTGTQKSSPLDLVPSDEKPGQYTADIVPSRPGTYTFHISGKAAGAVDQYFTSSDKTFDDVKDPATDEFPAKDPSTGQLAQRLDGTDTQVNAVKPAKTLSLVAVVVGAVGVLLGAGALLRKR